VLGRTGPARGNGERRPAKGNLGNRRWRRGTEVSPAAPVAGGEQEVVRRSARTGDRGGRGLGGGIEAADGRR
jgi:hypothetical protein